MSDEQLYFGGEIYTVDDDYQMPEAVAVSDGKIVAVGSKKECQSALGALFEPIDLRGSALLPGFIDTHLHPVLMVYFDMNVDLRGVPSLGRLQEKLRAAAKSCPAGGWVTGLAFDEQDLDKPRLPSRHDLDAACPDVPAIVVKHDGHMVIANTKAIQAAGVSASTENPAGGVIDREEDGSPAGPFREMAAQIIFSAMPLPDMDLLAEGARSSFAKLAARGITSIGAVLQTGEEGPAGSSGAFDVAAMNLFLEHIPVNLYGILMASDLETIEQARATGLHQETLGGHRIGAIKIYADGTFGSCTALMSQPFSDHKESTGFLTTSEEEIYRRMVFAHQAGLQVCVHAIGDLGNRKVIDLFDRLLKEYPRDDHRHRIEHASLLDASMLADMKRLGLVVSTQPLFIHSEKHWLLKRLGPDRVEWTYPYRSLVKARVTIAGASDCPVESTDVIHAISCCVMREGFETAQAITPEQAVAMYTIDAAYAQFEESIKGSITVGKRADLVILTANPASVLPDEIMNIRVEQTICGGKVIYKG